MKLLKFIKSDIIGSENTFHAWCVLASAAVVVAMGLYMGSGNVSFQGIAGSREANVNFAFPVEIKNILILPGQRVHKGDLLVELNQQELDGRIRILNAQIAKLRAEKSVRDQLNRAVGNTKEALNSDPLAIELQEQERELEVLERQRNNLFVFAEIDGIVGSVNFKRGETAPAFAPVVTISPESPTFVQGFIYERSNPDVKVGGVVRISALIAGNESVEGKVVSVGSRFVEIPQRISQTSSASVPVWGREVMVEITPGSKLMLGERVVISPTLGLMSRLKELVNGKTTAVDSATPEVPVEIRMPLASAQDLRIEASGAVYLPDMKKYLLVTKDSGVNNAPWMFLVGEDGQILERGMQASQLNELSGAQSISAEGEHIYIMGSLKGKAGKQRVFLHAKRRGLELYDIKSMDLSALVRQLIAESSDPVLRAIGAAEMKELQVKAHSVHNGSLYLGLKRPQTKNAETLILKIAQVNSLFESAAGARLEVWKTLDLNAGVAGDQRISDMTFVGTTLYFTTTARADTGGGFWSLEENSQTPRLMRALANVRPEGVAYNQERNAFFLTFGAGRAGSKFIAIKNGASPSNVN